MLLQALGGVKDVRAVGANGRKKPKSPARQRAVVEFPRPLWEDPAVDPLKGS